MSYRVFWTPHADEQLESILRMAVDQPLIAAAARSIDVRLVNDPSDLGESRLEMSAWPSVGLWELNSKC